MNFKDKIMFSVSDSVWASVWNPASDSVWNSVRESVIDSVWNSVFHSVQDSVKDSIDIKLKEYEFTK